MAKTRFFRIAVEGGTTDGRVIERAWIEQMAAGYNRATYTASINCEHIRGYSPEPPFNSYGVVDALKAEEIEIDVAGKKEKRLALLASLEPNDQLLAINRGKQKLFTSCEITPNMGGSGKAGLVGLAVTDNPASLGTEMLEFAAGKGDANPFTARKQDKANLFTAAIEADIALDDPTTESKGIVAAIVSGFATVAAQFSSKPAEPTPPPSPPATTGGTGAQAPANDNFAQAITALGTTIADAIKPIADGQVAAEARFKAIEAKLDTTPAPDNFSRKPATGGGATMVTDC
ncbi:GPO family capsid scaffolding protein [Sphingomonas sp.]|jgi:hypothetical protein|uniref:GPO family capsid scaffolding protein n=1 Tax=Sphingomonas sp. TaxID=28214 RepID=UPI000DBBEA94|nr:GPO family capsid scaffolding protein [Sphingomonas sp.]PZT91677.1 MAG: phage capsid protein [Sphingomonas sp.]